MRDKDIYNLYLDVCLSAVNVKFEEVMENRNVFSSIHCQV